MIRRALLSVSDKTGLAEFARGLAELGVELVSSGGTAGFLAGEGVPVRAVSDVTGFPEILGGRVKTLHPAIHGGILARRDEASHMEQLAAHGIGPIDLVAVNLYPFRHTVQQPGVTLEDAVENIDIGGPTMIRAAAKNHRHVVVVVDPADYPAVLDQLRSQPEVSEETRYRLAVTAFRHTAAYDALIARWLGERMMDADPFPQELVVAAEKVRELRYGENPHQRSALYRDPVGGLSLVGARQLGGKELSYNNLNDAAAALALCREFSDTAVVAVKHANPCGVAEGGTLAQAYRRAHDADPVSIFGGIVAVNRELDPETAEEMAEIFLEVIIAPAFSPKAVEILGRKKNLRLLETGPFEDLAALSFDLRRLDGGILVQTADPLGEDREGWRSVTKKQPTQAQLDDLLFAWKVAKWVKSNAIVVAKDRTTLGVGAGQMNRIESTRLALKAAGEAARGAVLASDAFFPFPDVVEAAGEAGVALIGQPGGGMRDELSIQAADERGMAMVFTGRRHFRH
ncbi:MAG: bifunctional phosphoribosylaminoimidazolecarboxamide formyltransferase/IMP cyclohydrolase [Thermaerobacter sp.]|jgi:phosphoribosylaminoimidazolecarboxamide formyltransferase/IMP cyclohydrolase|nr:bifunctional phosphoribosylaminoimidazolecarboxamide formyltransferase/IMP cyclohydrolase [Thermaerobacter sp.]